MTEYFILSKYFSIENPAYALVDDDKCPNQIVCHTGSHGNKGHWKLVHDGPPISPFFRLELSDDTDHRLAEQDDKTKNVVAGERGDVWIISPPLYERGPDTPRTEWTIHGNPEEIKIPDSLVRIDTRMFHVDVDLKSLWYIQEVGPKA